MEALIILEFLWRNSLHPVDADSGQMLQQKKNNNNKTTDNKHNMPPYCLSGVFQVSGRFW